VDIPGDPIRIRRVVDARLTRASMSQIIDLRCLGPDIQEALLFLPRTRNGRDPVPPWAVPLRPQRERGARAESGQQSRPEILTLEKHGAVRDRRPHGAFGVNPSPAGLATRPCG